MLLRRGGLSAVCGRDPPLVTVGRAALPDLHRRGRGLLPRRPPRPFSGAGASERPPPSDDDRVAATRACGALTGSASRCGRAPLGEVDGGPRRQGGAQLRRLVLGGRGTLGHGWDLTA